MDTSEVPTAPDIPPDEQTDRSLKDDSALIKPNSV